MTLRELLLGAMEALKDLGRQEKAKDVLILRDCIAKSLRMGTGDKPKWN